MLALNLKLHIIMKLFFGRIRLPVSTTSRTYELSEETHVTPFRTYRFHSTGLCNYKP